MRSGVRSDPGRWTDGRQVHGLEAERQAIDYLRSRGWSVLAHRFRVSRHEIDLIVRRGSLVAFVEVKSRRTLRWGAPAEAVDAGKRHTVARVATVWAEQHGRPGDTYRFDVIGLSAGHLDHIEDAWRVER